MNRHFISFFLSILFLLGNNLFAQSPIGSTLEDEREELLWKGFKRYNLIFNDKEARLVVPNQSLPGKPWIWRARFPDWHTEADSILVSEGFHLAFINTNDKYGSPDAMDIWDRFFEFLTEQYNLQNKVSLLGVSRGGLFIYNWAKRNPDKVFSIYAEAPVCDFKSWPAGFGKSDGSPLDWVRLKEEYGFINDEAAKQYSNNPIDNLELLAEQKVPILHMIGLEDEIVPPEENTSLLINKYISLGGPATVVPCTKAPQKLKGHHFPIESPRFVADFIKYHSLKNAPLQHTKYHLRTRKLLNSYINFEREKIGRVAFLGGSITYNPGWRDSVCAFLQRRFPHTEFEFINAGIPSMGSTPAAFRLENDVLSFGKIDLLFEEAAVNDATNGRTSTEQIRAMEGILRHLLRSNPSIDVVMMHFVDPDKIEDYNNGIEPEVIGNHNRVAEHYNIPTINLAQEVTDRINNGEFTWEIDFKNVHPSPFGQGIYANSIIKFLEKSFSGNINSDEKIITVNLPDRIDKYSYDNGSLIDVTSASFTEGWNIDPNWDPKDGIGTRPNFVKVPMLIGNNSGGILKFEFQGNAAGIAVAAGQDAGIIEYRIDNDEWTELNLFTEWSSYLHLPWYYTLAAELSQGKHLLEIRMTDKKDDRSKGYACRIRYFYINKN